MNDKETNMTNHLAPAKQSWCGRLYKVPFSGRRRSCQSWIDSHGVGEIWPDYDGGFQVRVYL